MSSNTMKIECICGKDKPHGQICWLRTEIEIPLQNNDEHYIETETIQREIPICRSCLKRILNEREGESLGFEKLLDYLRKRYKFIDHDDEGHPEVLDAVAQLVIDLHERKLEPA